MFTACFRSLLVIVFLSLFCTVLAAQIKETPAAQTIPASQNIPAAKPAVQIPSPVAAPPIASVLKAGTEVNLKLMDTVTSKNSAKGSVVNFVLNEDLKVGEFVIKAGAKAVGTVAYAQKAAKVRRNLSGEGELGINVNYLVVGDSQVKLRGAVRKRGFGSDGPFSGRGKDVEVQAGTSLVCYIEEDTSLAADAAGKLAIVPTASLPTPAQATAVESHENSSSSTRGAAEKRSQSPTARELILDDGTPMQLQLTEPLSSSSTAVGEEVLFEVKDDVKVGDQIVIARGAIASATITIAEHKKRRSRGGKLGLVLRSVSTITGEKVDLRGVEVKKEKSNLGSNMLGVVGASGSPREALILAPIILPFVALLSKGDEVGIPRGQTITGFVNSSTALDASRIRAANVSLRQKRQTASFIDPSLARLLIYRLGFSLAHNNAVGRRPSVYLDGAEIARLRTSSFIGLKILPGQHVLKSSDNRPMELKLEGGKQYWVRIDVTGFFSRASLITLDHRPAVDELSSLSSMDPKDITLPASVQSFENIPAEP